MRKLNKNAFTLIELLAVIVILAIIALIAVPVIMNIIDKANKSAFKDTAYGIISAGELYFAEQQLDINGMSNNERIQLPDTTKKLELKGEIPEGEILITKEGKIALFIKNNRYCVTKGLEDKDITVTETYEKCKNPALPKSLSELATTSTEITKLPDCITNNTTCTAGTKVAVKVNETETYNFYVISENDNKVTLIMDRNLGDRVAWVSKIDYNDDKNFGDYGNNNKGPITLLNYLNSETSDWTNIPAIESYTYDNNLNGTTNKYGYQKLEITNGTGILISQDGNTTTTLAGTSRARILTYEEASDLAAVNDVGWLYTNLNSSETTEEPHGYWFLTAKPSYSSCGRTLSISGGRDSYKHVYVEMSHSGARPVIELTK